jgi:CRP-like cAMP-binding protein
MSLLTGEPRTATVSAVDDCEVLEIAVDGFREVVMANPAVVEEIGREVLARRESLERIRAAGTDDRVPETPRGFLERVKRFLRLSPEV